jgi:hypothetical protein
MVEGVLMVAVRRVRVVSSFLVLARFVMFRGFFVMPCGLLVVLSGFAMMLCGLSGHARGPPSGVGSECTSYEAETVHSLRFTP